MFELYRDIRFEITIAICELILSFHFRYFENDFHRNKFLNYIREIRSKRFKQKYGK